MIKIISGATRIGSKMMREIDGEFTAPPEIEARLVRRGVAEYVTPVATPVYEEIDTKSSVNAPEEKNAIIGDSYDVPTYDEDSTVAQLREIGKTAGLSFKVGMKKADMISALDDYFGGAVEFRAEDPIV